MTLRDDKSKHINGIPLPDIGVLDEQGKIEDGQVSAQLVNALFEINALATSTQTDTDFYRSIHQHLKKLLPADNLFIVLSDEQIQKFEVVYYAVDNDELEPNSINKLSIQEQRRTFAAYAIRHAKPVLLNKKQQQRLIELGVTEQVGELTQSWLGIPLCISGHLHGLLVMQVTNGPYQYTAQDVFIAQHFGRVIAMTISARLNQHQLQQQVAQATDKLTALNQELENQLEETRRNNKILTVLQNLSQAALNTDLSIHGYCEYMHQQISDLVYAKNFYVILSELDSEEFKFVYFADSMDPTRLEDLSALPAERLKKSLTGQVIEKGSPILIDRAGIDSLLESEKIIAGGAMTEIWLGLPLIVENRVLNNCSKIVCN